MRISKESLDTRVMNCKSLELIKKKRKLLIIVKTKKLIVVTLE